MIPKRTTPRERGEYISGPNHTGCLIILIILIGILAGLIKLGCSVFE